MPQLRAGPCTTMVDEGPPLGSEQDISSNLPTRSDGFAEGGKHGTVLWHTASVWKTPHARL